MKSRWDYGLGRSLHLVAFGRLVVGHLIHEAGQIRAQRIGSTPTVLPLSAQGCRVGAATLGHRSRIVSNPNGVASNRPPAARQMTPERATLSGEWHLHKA
jgi:hypothetical protein